MDSRFSGQRVMVATEPLELGTIVGETRNWFAVRTETGDVIMAQKRYTYRYDAATFQRIEDEHRKFLEARTSLKAAWANLVPLVGDQELRFAEAADVHELTLKETDVQPLLQGYGNGRGIASGPVTVVRSADELHKVKSDDVLVAEQAELTWPWFQAAMRASALVVEYDALLRCAFTLSWEVGIPCLIMASHATQVLKDGQIVTVDSRSVGGVYQGNMLGV